MNSKERSILRKYAIRLNPVFQVGAAQGHEKLYDGVRNYINKHELMKIKVNREDIYDKKVAMVNAKKIAKSVGAEVVDVIGTTIILYKKHEDVEKRKYLK